jgi:hypothetical protein
MPHRRRSCDAGRGECFTSARTAWRSVRATEHDVRRQLRNGERGTRVRRTAGSLRSCRVAPTIISTMSRPMATARIRPATSATSPTCEVEDAVDEQCLRRVGPPRGRHRREVPARAVAADREPRRAAAEARRLPVRPAHCREAVLERCRERVLRGQAVIDVEDQVAGLGEAVGELPVGLRAAADPAAAVQVHEHRVPAPRGTTTSAVTPSRTVRLREGAHLGRPAFRKGEAVEHGASRTGSSARSGASSASVRRRRARARSWHLQFRDSR